MLIHNHASAIQCQSFTFACEIIAESTVDDKSESHMQQGNIIL
jgi:hypothetical protein